MYHGLKHDAIYAACRLEAVMVGPGGLEKRITGTGFGVLIDGRVALVTNRHIVEANWGRQDAKYVGFKLEALYCDVRDKNNEDGTPGSHHRLIVPMSHNEILFDQNYSNDVAVIMDVQSGNLDGSDVRPWAHCITYDLIATEEELYNDLKPFDVLAFPGYPMGYDRNGVRAIIRGGSVACDPRFEYNYEDEDKGEIILYEGFSFGGSSGSPVLAIPKIVPINAANQNLKSRRFMLVGINAGHIDDERGQHQGLSYFVRSSVIRRIIDPLL